VLDGVEAVCTLVCVKHVPDATDIRFDSITLNLIREGVPSIVNHFCLNAIEEAVRLKERLGGTITALSMGGTDGNRKG
jgi:electron transfer flavoprotein alpha/beta subunit